MEANANTITTMGIISNEVNNPTSPLITTDISIRKYRICL